MTIVLDVSFNDHQSSQSDSQTSAINEVSRKKVKEKHSAKAVKVAKVKNKVSDIDADSSSPVVEFIAIESLRKPAFRYLATFFIPTACSMHAENNNGWAAIMLIVISRD